MIASATDFGDYFDGVRRRTVHFVQAIPADRIDWRPQGVVCTIDAPIDAVRETGHSA